MLSTREWYYGFGLYHTLASLSWGYTIVFTLKNDTKDYLEAIEKYKVDNIQIVPTTITDLIKYPELHKYDVSSLQVMFCTSMPISSELLACAKDKFKSLKKMTQVYGLTEVGCIIREDGDTEKNKLGSVGVANAGTVFKVVDLETQQPVGPYKHGEIRFKSLSLMSGYIGDEERDYLDEEGFYKSGDVGYYDDNKHFYIVDRIKEMIKHKGCSLSPSEIENVLLKHTSIRDVGVTSLPFSEAPVAFIVRQINCDINEKQVAEYLNSKMPSVTMSGGIRFVEKLPRGAGTKLDRKALRNMI
ncbi:luciferin 4-monooxygenase-like [Colias croceus]|uniref:luciferin 4-monooxygenase-like n=1 Tax=Colias crocea TaxID=72248 RepID=UPI001E27A569|nr:luciferin 4-monooxygenase-like [Colias croceus]